MGISLKHRRRRGRRSYADYRPPSRNPGPRDDPFRIVFYLVVIGAGVWAYFNQPTVSGWLYGGQPVTVQTATDLPSVTPITSTPVGQAAQDLAAQAQAAYDAGHLSDAIDLYRQAGQLSPNTVDYPFEEARLLVFNSAMQYRDTRQQTLSQAADAANRAILADPTNPAGYAILGKVNDWQGNPDQALSQILQALEVDEKYPLGLSYYAEALVDLDRWDQATQTINQALDADPNSVDIRRDSAYIFETLGDYSSAATQYEAAIAIAPNLPFLHMALGRDYRQLGRFNDALDQFFKAQLVEPSNALIPYEVGRTYETFIGDPNSALDYYQRATDMDASYGSPWLRIGALRFAQARYQDAVVAFEHALALNTVSNDMYYQLGLSYANVGRCTDAMQYLQQAQSSAGDDQRILDAVQQGYSLCSQSTPVPVDVLGTPTPTPTP